MKRTASFLFVLALTLGLATASFGQAVPCAKSAPTLETTFAPYVIGEITTAPGAAGQNYVVGVGVEHDGSRFYFDGSGVYSSAATAVNPGAGHVGLFKLQGYYKIKGHLLVGGGATTAVNTGAIISGQVYNTAKAQANGFAGAGLEFGRFRTIASYQIPWRGNGVPEQIKFNLDSELAITRHIRFVLPLVASSYQTAPFKSLGGQRVTIAQVGGGLKLVW